MRNGIAVVESVATYCNSVASILINLSVPSYLCNGYLSRLYHHIYVIDVQCILSYLCHGYVSGVYCNLCHGYVSVSPPLICLLQYTCLNTQYKCRGNETVSDRCIPINKQCDGHPDCIAGEDEENCPPKTCPPNQVKTFQHNYGVMGYETVLSGMWLPWLVT